MSITQEDLATIEAWLLSRGILPSPAPCGRGGGAVFTGVKAGTYNIGGGSITVNGKGQILSITPGGGGGGSISILDEGSVVVASANSVDFVGAGVQVTATGPNDAEVEIRPVLPWVAAIAGTNTTATAWETLRYDGTASLGPYTINAPGAPSNNDMFQVKEIAGGNSPQVTLSGNGAQIERINGTPSAAFPPRRRFIALTYQFDSAANIWRLV